MARRTIARDKAVAKIEELIGNARRTGEYRLPTVGALASLAQVSLVTMLAAVRLVRDRGDVRVSHGKGTVVNAQPAQATRHEIVGVPGAVPGLRSKRHALQARLLNEIYDGAYLSEGRLPSLKALSGMLGTSYRTVRAVLDGLVRQGVLTTDQRSYVPADFVRPRLSQNIVLITAGDPEGNISLLTPHTSELVRSLVDECARRNLRLEVGTFHLQTGVLTLPPLARRSLRLGRGSAEVAGFLVWTTSINWDTLHRLLLDLSLRQNAPVLVLDEGGELVLPVGLSSRTPPQLFHFAGAVEPGRAIGRHLLSLGHRRVAYISCSHHAVFSQNRLKGLSEAFGAAGLTDGIVPFVSEAKVGAGQVWFGDSVQRAINRLADRVAPFKQEHLLLREYRASFGGKLGQLFGLYRDSEQLRPSLDAALSDKRITAWVAANDNMAVHCLDFLARKGVGVPTDMSVAGFDDSLEALFHGLTSYNFNEQGVIRAMLARVLTANSPRMGLVHRGGATVIPGSVNARKSTGKARRTAR
jgi:DNA-binding FadR family transcriptional regulator